MGMLRRTVIITGASGGIGSACALKFAKEGYNIALCHLTHGTEDLEEKIKEFNVEAKSYQFDLADAKATKKAFDKIFADFESVTCLISNAGIVQSHPLLTDNEVEEIDRVLDVNLRGCILTNKLAIAYFMEKKHGNIVNISSIHGIHGSACESIYSATKSGIIGLTNSLSGEVAPFGIRVNAIAPGFIDTNMTAVFSEKERKDIIARTPLARTGQPEDIANAAFFLASEHSSFITGVTLPVTGGVVKF